MSEYVSITTQFRFPEALCLALQDLGFRPEEIEVHPAPVPLYGYRGDLRPERAEIVIRRRHVGLRSNDLGFARHTDGTYRAIVSEYDQRSTSTRGPYDRGWLGRLAQRYAVRLIERAYQQQGYAVSSQALADGAVDVVAEGIIQVGR